MASYRDLKVWQKAMDFVEAIYQETGGFPSGERLGLAAQMRRAAVSIPSNIAEGSARNSKKDYAQFVGIAYGSCCELETQMEISQRLGLVAPPAYARLAEDISHISRMLKALRTALRGSATPNPRNAA